MQLVGFCISVEGMQFSVELLFVKQMYQLTAMEFDGVDEKDSIVDTWYDRCICVGQTASAVLRFPRQVSKVQIVNVFCTPG
jgi:hypothetical protein